MSLRVCRATRYIANLIARQLHDLQAARKQAKPLAGGEKQAIARYMTADLDKSDLQSWSCSCSLLVHCSTYDDTRVFGSVTFYNIQLESIDR